MERQPALEYALRSGVVALGAGLAGLLPLAFWEKGLLPFASTGWALMAVAGVAGGAWLVREQPRPGSRFFLAMAAGMLGKIAAAGAAAVPAVVRGGPAVFAYAFGLVLGFLPLQAVEIWWFSGGGARRPDGTRLS